jgi:hypothetical protein
MNSESLRALQAPIKDRYRAEPAAASMIPKGLAARLKPGERS